MRPAYFAPTAADTLPWKPATPFQVPRDCMSAAHLSALQVVVQQHINDTVAAWRAVWEQSKAAPIIDAQPTAGAE